MASKVDYDVGVFINCPYDTSYKPLLDAVAFAVHDCGFVVRIALEDAGTGQVRLDKIREIIEQCRYSIHDLSLPNKPRLNMAFETGLFFGAKLFGSAKQRQKDLLVLDSVPHRYKETLSDIAGQDAAIHGDDPVKAIDCVRTFLVRKAGKDGFRGGAEIAKRYAEFNKVKPKLAREAKITTAELNSLDYFKDLLDMMTAWQALYP